MPVTLLVGPETSLQNTDNNPRDMEANVNELEPSAAPLVALMDKMGSKPATNPKIEWLENEAMPRITTLSASAQSNATAFGVSADIFRPGDVVRLSSQGFAILVTATAAGAITGTKVGSTAQVSAQTGSELFLVSNANQEGSTLREIKHPQLVTASNYCQIIEQEFGVTGTEDATEHYGGDERARLTRYFGIEHARAKDQTFFFGARDITGTQRMCGGLKEFLATNVTNDTGGTTEAEWLTFLEQGFRFGSDSKVAFLSPRALSTIEGFARANLQVNDNAAERYGVAMRTYVSGQGEVNLVKMRYWRDSSTFNGYAFLVDMDAILERPLRKTRLRTNVHAPDYDGFKDQYIYEGSIQIKHERKHALMTGIS